MEWIPWLLLTLLVSMGFILWEPSPKDNYDVFLKERLGIKLSKKSLAKGKNS